MAGYIPAGLTQEEIDRAIAMSQGKSGLVQPMPEQALPPEQPQQIAPPPASPEDSPVELSPAESAEQPLTVAPVEVATGKTADRLKTYQGDALETENERIANAGKLGDGHGQDAQSYADQAEIQKRSAAQNKATADSAKTDVEERKRHEADMQARADAIYREMESKRQPPPDSMVSKVLAVIGMVTSLGGQKNGVAQGLATLASMMGSDKERWALEQQANSGVYKAALEGVRSDRDGAVNDLETAQRIASLEALEIHDSLEAVKSMGLGRNAVATATDLQLKLKDEVLRGLARAEGEKLSLEQKAAAAASKAARSRAETDPLWRMPLEALKALNAGGGLSEQGQKILAERIKYDQSDRGGEAGIDAKKAEASRKALEAEGGVGQEVLPGMVATVPLEKKDVSDIRANAQVLSKIKGNYAKLAEIRDRHAGKAFSTWEHPEDEKLAQNIISEMTGTLNQFSGRGAPSNLELEDMKKQLLDPTDMYGLTDPKKVYRGQIERLENNFKQSLEAVGVQRVGGEKEEQPSPAKKQITFKRDAGQSTDPAQRLAQQYIESREGKGAGGI